jgi:hypothetical protein
VLPEEVEQEEHFTFQLCSYMFVHVKILEYGAFTCGAGEFIINFFNWGFNADCFPCENQVCWESEFLTFSLLRV